MQHPPPKLKKIIKSLWIQYLNIFRKIYKNKPSKLNDSMVHVDFESEDGKYLQHLIKLDFSLLQSN